jgi:hypothetical protein
MEEHPKEERKRNKKVTFIHSITNPSPLVPQFHRLLKFKEFSKGFNDALGKEGNPRGREK